MNLTRTLDVSLPDMPNIRLAETFPRFNPATITKEFNEGGQRTIGALVPKTRKVFIFTPEQWDLFRLFDGRRSFEQVSELALKKLGLRRSPDDLRKMAETLDGAGFWLKTPAEESISLANDLAQQRQIKKSIKFNPSKMHLFVFDADNAITKAYSKIRYLYHPYGVLASLFVLGLMVATWIAHWPEVWGDSLAYWNMTEKTGRDLLEFYLLFGFIGFFHESGHAITAKHFGAEVHRTGLMLVYTSPAFFVDSSEVWVHGGRNQRVATILAGFWYELLLCAVATLIWWGTAPNNWIHDFAYKVILIGGIMPVLLNMNPLMRLDGYLAFCEILRTPGLREKANMFWSRWVQKNIFKLPVAVPALPRKRQIFFAAYSVLAGAYTYFILLFLSKLTYKIVHHWTIEWAWVPATFVALKVFRGRIEKLVAFLKTLYLNKKDFMVKHRIKLVVAVAALVTFLFLPIFRETAHGPVILEPVQRAVIRAEVDGRVDQVLVSEGDQVSPGAPLFRLSDIGLESEQALANSRLRVAAAKSTDAHLRYADFAKAESERRDWSEQARIAGDKSSRLSLDSPIAGTIATPRPHDFEGRWVKAGETLAEVHDDSVLRARVYINDADMRALTYVSGHSIKLQSRMGPLHGQLSSISSAPQVPEAGLMVTAGKIQGLKALPQYAAIVLLQNDGTLRTGMTGEAKVFGKRRSIAGMAFHPLADFVGRKFW